MLLYQIISWSSELKSKTVIKVRSETHRIGASSGMLSNVAYSESSADKSAAISLLNLAVVKANAENASPTADGIIHYLTLFTDDGAEYTLTVENGLISFESDKYMILGEIPTLDSPSVKAHAFIMNADSQVWEYYDNGELKATISPTEKIEFTEYYGPITLMIPTRHIDTGFGIIRPYNERIFSYQQKGADTVVYYELISDFSFPVTE